jgi:uroporphyrinogen III methyltransferase / synthase
LSDPTTPAEAETGRVYLVGAGPGDPGLLTARALELIARADTILYDRLIPAQALERARADAELLFVGKQGGGDSVPQEQTEALLVERARAGREVVRLKGGDPFVFGRGGEEALALRAAGIPFEVVPGVTAGVAAPAYAGIPVTHRGRAAAVAFVTGHEDPAKGSSLALDWPALAAFPGTLVFYMGVRRIAEIQAALLAAGRPPEQPAAVIERGTLPGQRVVRGTLASIAGLAAAEQMRAPAITLIGEVAGLAESLDWLAQGPLAGRAVAVTRARAKASELAQRLSALGASVVQAPAIRIHPLPGPPLDPSPYELICLTSPNGVECLFERLRTGGRDARSLAGACVAAIGPGTARALREHGIEPDVVPERFVAESLVEALEGVQARRALIARAREARELLPEALRARGMQVDVLDLYETLAEPLREEELRRALGADYITFTSSSTVRFFLQAARGQATASTSPAYPAAPASASVVTPAPAPAETATTATTSRNPLLGSLSPTVRVVSIGPVTSATLREHGIEPHVEAARHDIDGLIEALVADAGGRQVT